MLYIKNFNQLLESIKNINSKNNWNIGYNHYPGHDLDVTLSERTNVTEDVFEKIIEMIVQKCQKSNLIGTWVFASFKYQIKILANVEPNKKEIFIITILGNNENLKKTNNIIVI